MFLIDNNVAKVILTISLFIIIFCIMNLLITLNIFFSNAGKKEKAIEENYLKLTENLNNKPMADKMDNSIELLNLCNNLIKFEVLNQLKQYVQLGNKYEYLNLDKDASVIAEAVFNSLDSTVFSSNDYVLSKEYIMRYIADNTINTLLAETRNHNAELLLK